jgi:hypothetical protein
MLSRHVHVGCRGGALLPAAHAPPGCLCSRPVYFPPGSHSGRTVTHFTTYSTLQSAATNQGSTQADAMALCAFTAATKRWAPGRCPYTRSIPCPVRQSPINMYACLLDADTSTRHLQATSLLLQLGTTHCFKVAAAKPLTHTKTVHARHQSSLKLTGHMKYPTQVCCRAMVIAPSTACYCQGGSCWLRRLTLPTTKCSGQSMRPNPAGATLAGQLWTQLLTSALRVNLTRSLSCRKTAAAFPHDHDSKATKVT